ncbi:helix-turn-helix domain-containing protein [Arthrobacter sedimenti]|uniref:helix-turn-helix domain-containing protein n=1 Tax=Arthrobacter sedimenti TaxID=2694931 RepID=UPI000B35B9B0|nr:hypothetical protein B8W73_02685 [Arthrobacter agilis]
MTDRAPDEQPKPLRFLTLAQVAEELNTRHSTIRALIGSGELPAIQIGGRGQWRIERSRLEDYIAAAYAKARSDIAHGDLESTTGSITETGTEADTEASSEAVIETGAGAG